MFDALGLDQVEQSTYTALVDRSPATVDDLQPVVGVVHSRLAEALDALEAKGLIIRRPGTLAQYAAVDPEIALDVLILDREEQLKRARLAAQQLAARFRHNAGRSDPAELIEVVTGQEAVIRRVLQIQRSARQEVRFIDRPPYLLPAASMSGTEVEQLDRDLRYRGIYDPVGLQTDAHDLRGDMELTIARGEHARLLPHTPVKLLLIDDRYACVPLQAAPEELVTIVIVHPSGLLEALSALFEALWQRALPLVLGDDHAFAHPNNGHPTQDDRRLLALLTAGVADRVAAKQLNISPRTFQRRIQDLLTRLGTETRFQAGLQAGLLGWISRLDSRRPATANDDGSTLGGSRVPSDVE